MENSVELNKKMCLLQEMKQNEKEDLIPLHFISKIIIKFTSCFGWVGKKLLVLTWDVIDYSSLFLEVNPLNPQL
jgi:hypothetical protein